MRRHAFLISLLTLSMGATIWVTSMDKIGFMYPFTYKELLKEGLYHLQMVLIAELIAIFIGVALGILVTRPVFKKLATPVVGGASVGQAIPSMGILAVMVPLVGFGLLPALIALVIWGIPPILRNSYAAINNVNPAIVEAARGMGMTKGQIAWKVETPLALPVIMSGIRISTVVLVGTAALAAIIGSGGLGKIILAGIAANSPLIILQGAAPVAAMAITLGFILERIEEWMTPQGLKLLKGGMGMR